MNKLVMTLILVILMLASMLCLGSQTAALVDPPCDLCPSTSIVWESFKDGNSEIYIAAPDATRLQNLTNNAAEDIAPALSPDGRRVAFSSNRSGSYSLYVMDADGQNVRLVPTPGIELVGSCSWSPDGAMLAFSGYTGGNSDIYIVRPDGTGFRQITTNLAFESGTSWSPDGIHIAFHRGQSGKYQLYTVNILTLEERQLTDGPGSNSQPAWSPDGKLIAFASTRSAPYDWQIYTMDPNGGNVVAVTGGPALNTSPAWSPDGSQLVFERYIDPLVNRADIYRIRRDGTGLAIVSNDSAAERSPSWAPVCYPAADLAKAGLQINLRYKDLS